LFKYIAEIRASEI